MSESLETLDKLRGDGWSVAVHNDYRLKGEKHTFWLLTYDPLCIFVKGEGPTDEDAFAQMFPHALHVNAVKSRRAKEAVLDILARIDEGQTTFTAEQLMHTLRSHGWGRPITTGTVA